MQRLGPCRGQLDCLPGICFCLHVSHTIKQTYMVVFYYLITLPLKIFATEDADHAAILSGDSVCAPWRLDEL